MERQHYIAIAKEKAALKGVGGGGRREGRKRNPKQRYPGDDLVEKRVSVFIFTWLPRPW